MKRIATFLPMLLFAAGLLAQPFVGVSWVNWAQEPDSPDDSSYMDTPYDNPVVEVPMAPADWSYDGITDAATFEATWGILGDSMAVANLTSDPANGDFFDLGTGNTFGAAWKGVHDGSKFYVLLKYWDANAQVGADSRTFEITAQPTSFRYDTATFNMVTRDSADNPNLRAYQNMAYARYVELGGGKAVFNDGQVSAYEASIGLGPDKKAWIPYTTGSWGNNEQGLLALASSSHFWDEAEDGTIRAIMVMTFDGALSYPEDPADLDNNRIALQVGDTIAFDVKSNSSVPGDPDPLKIEYFWSADKNNGYASNYYSGHVVMMPEPTAAEDLPFVGVSWVNWAQEPDYEGDSSYADTPYENRPLVDILQAPDAWTYESIADAATFETTWGLLGDSMAVANLTSDPANGDLFDLGDGNTFGAAWKGVHDGSNFYVLLKYWDSNAQANADSRTFEIMAQPASPVRHEPTFTAASDSAENVRAYQNMAYARYVELGGGKAVFNDGQVSAYEASIGLGPDKKAWIPYTTGSWGNNEQGLLALASTTHFWDEAEDGTIRAIMVMSFDGALSYPVDPTALDGDRLGVKVGDTFALDVKTNAAVPGEEDPLKIEYFWSSDKNNGYASNYYSGHITLKEEQISVGLRERIASTVKVFVYQDMLHIRGVESSDLKIYSITGSLVKSVQNVSGTLPLRDLADGVYMVKIEGIPSGFKVVK